LLMLDQRYLPSKIQWRTYKTAAQVADGIRDMVVRGAPAIGCVAGTPARELIRSQMPFWALRPAMATHANA